jgi:hypothetical protein
LRSKNMVGLSCSKLKSSETSKPASLSSLSQTFKLGDHGKQIEIVFQNQKQLKM